jgi:16S rRNA (cytosine967-C5)-methyltransferase
LAKSNTVSPARLAAFDVLKQVDDGTFSSVALAAVDTELSSLDRALCQELVMGVLRWQLQLDAVIEHFAARKIQTLDLPVLLALRLGIYQLRFLSRVPASAAVNESVNLVGRARLTSARPFVNGVLRNVARQPDYSPSANIDGSLERLAVETSHPKWLIERWVAAFGVEEAELFARANNQTPSIAIRAVRSITEEDHVLADLLSDGAVLTRSEITDRAWTVSGATAKVRELVERGEVYVQDEASQLVGAVVDAKPGDRVLDACAAPGSKTSLIADRASDSALVVAMDISVGRLSTVAKTLEVHRLKRVSLMIGDASDLFPFKSESFDRVLLDAPCSGTGTLRHNPEIRWRLTDGDIKRLAEQQLRFLQNASVVVKPGGVLVYSTCSVEPEENEGVIEEFLLANGQYKQIPVVVKPELLVAGGAARTWPHKHGTDGFYIAALRRE